ncbi:MAG TPA: hypothetical protein VIK89_08715 [Cytophagaceae bacterium]
MATCGYICPSCGGTKIDSEGKDCQWCNTTENTGHNKHSSDEDTDLTEWIREVHEGKCCSD